MVLNPFHLVRKQLDNIPTRFNVAVMLFMACLISYMLRVNMSVNILAMVMPSSLSNNTVELEDYGPRYNWTASQQSAILGAYFYGYLVTSLPAGVFAERFGGRIMVGTTMGASAFVTALCPIAASIGLWAIITTRIILGILGGFLYPALHSLISKWAPPDEKGKFVSALMGGTFGTVVTWPLVGILIETVGWVWAFYVPALITLVVVVVWFLLVADSPEDHTRIKPEEKDFINKSLGDTLSKSKAWPPVLKLLTSLPFWSLLILHFGNLWGLYFLLTAAPKFMNEVLGFNLSKAGFLASLPYLARLLSAFMFGAIGDWIRRKSLLGVTTVRKSFCLFSHIIPGLFLILITLVGKDPYVCVAIMTLSLGFNGASTMTNLQNSQDLAPNFAGTIYGIINFVGTTSGFISPILVAHFTKESNTMDEWKYVFLIGAGVYIVPALIFMIFGSGLIQKWNEPKLKIKTDAENK